MVKELTDNLLDFVALGPGFPLRHVSQLLRRRYHTTTIRGGGRITFRPASSDALTFIDIFRRGAYDFSWIERYSHVVERYRELIAAGRRPVIVDAGANVGAASIWFAERFPEALIRALEPDPDNAELLRINVGTRPNVEVIEAAVGGQTGRVTLTNPRQEAWAVRTQRDTAGSVPLMTIPELLRRNGEEKSLFLVKIDIEGFESDLFESNLGWLDDVEVVIIEPHDWMLPGNGSSRSFRKAMLERDFEVVVCGENIVFLRT